MSRITRLSVFALIAITIVAIATLAVLDAHSQSRFSELRKRVQQAGGRVVISPEIAPSWSRWGLYVQGRDARFETILGIDVEGCDISPEWMDDLPLMASIEELRLSGTGVTDERLACISGLNCLERLVIVDTAITDDGLRALSDLDALVMLTFSGSALTGQGLEYLCGCHHLEVFHLERTDTLDELYLSATGCLSRVSEISFAGSAVTSGHLAFLNDAAVRKLNLDGTNVSDVDVRMLAEMNLQLEELSLVDTRVSDLALTELIRMCPRHLFLPQSVSVESVNSFNASCSGCYARRMERALYYR